MTNFKPSDFLDELYRNHYSKNKSDHPGISWYEPRHKETHKYIATNLQNINTNYDIEHNLQKHYQLLRIIIFTICRKRTNHDYLNFIKELLMYLEQQSISMEHEVNRGELYNLLTLPILRKFFYNSTRKSVTISNSIITRVNDILIDNDDESKKICNTIQSYINSTSRTNTSRTNTSRTNRTNTRYHPYSKTYDKAGKKRRRKKAIKARTIRKKNKY